MGENLPSVQDSTNKKITCRTEPLEAGSKRVWAPHNSFRLFSSHTPPLHLPQRAPGKCKEEDCSSGGSGARQPAGGGGRLWWKPCHSRELSLAKGYRLVFPSSACLPRKHRGSVEGSCPRRNPSHVLRRSPDGGSSPSPQPGLSHPDGVSELLPSEAAQPGGLDSNSRPPAAYSGGRGAGGTSFSSSLGLDFAHLQNGASGQPVLCFC